MAEAEVFNSLKESDSFKRCFWPSENGNDLIKSLRMNTQDTIINLDEKCFHHLFMGSFLKALSTMTPILTLRENSK